MKNAMIGVLLVLVGALATMLFLSLSHSRQTIFTIPPTGTCSSPQTQTPLRVEPNQPERNIEATSQPKQPEKTEVKLQDSFAKTVFSEIGRAHV
jgi:hypothetical protein